MEIKVTGGSGYPSGLLPTCSAGLGSMRSFPKRRQDSGTDTTTWEVRWCFETASNPCRSHATHKQYVKKGDPNIFNLTYYTSGCLNQPHSTWFQICPCLAVWNGDVKAQIVIDWILPQWMQKPIHDELVGNPALSPDAFDVLRMSSKNHFSRKKQNPSLQRFDSWWLNTSSSSLRTSNFSTIPSFPSSSSCWSC